MCSSDLAAAQPFISGAISKTVNMPEHVTVEEVEQLFIESWKLGLKAVAIYRDNCKVAQPLSADKKKGATVTEPADLARPERKRLPSLRPSTTRSFQVGDAEGYITAGMYPDKGNAFTLFNRAESNAVSTPCRNGEAADRAMKCGL